MGVVAREGLVIAALKVNTLRHRAVLAIIGANNRRFDTGLRRNIVADVSVATVLKVADEVIGLMSASTSCRVATVNCALDIVITWGGGSLARTRHIVAH
jgi:hypothetical protein